MNKEIVVLIGGPSSGKTTLIDALKEKGHTCYPEVSREVIREAQELDMGVLVIDSEHALDFEFMEAIGVDVTRDDCRLLISNSIRKFYS